MKQLFINGKYYTITSSSFFLLFTLRNRLPRGCFSDHYNRNLVKSKVNHLYYPHIRITCVFYSVTLYLEWLMRFLLGEYHCKTNKFEEARETLDETGNPFLNRKPGISAHVQKNGEESELD